MKYVKIFGITFIVSFYSCSSYYVNIDALKKKEFNKNKKGRML